jgi:hypothetical protein
MERMKKVKCLILLMSCNHSFFKKEEDMVKQTWLKPIVDNKYDGFDYMFYTSGPTDFIDYTRHIVYVNSPDDWEGTFVKTKQALNIINKEFDYDYIVRTNLSTYINIPLLQIIINSGALDPYKDSTLFGGQLIKNNGVFYPCGNFLLFSKHLAEEIVKSDINEIKADDYIIGKILTNYRKHIFNVVNINYGTMHQIYNDINDDLYNKIAISYRVYNFDSYETYYKLREIQEFHMLNKLHNHMLNMKIDINNVMECLNYQNNIYFEHNVGFKQF